ncbi:hypothetical protein RN347_07310 [Halomonas sp. PAMB 3264]|uniref:hypothetical protein n=1 Tax=Halomonas sp. PAMB 3264 TaxID=3075222 RepID=UPI00289E136C|nr:hypothetical protein [Halomonas sp. PAMB 3264]WNL43701.1 hypothetical protein RN347_07310 [Halomonas sp. PAMB 3264]
MAGTQRQIVAARSLDLTADSGDSDTGSRQLTRSPASHQRASPLRRARRRAIRGLGADMDDMLGVDSLAC